MASWAEIGMEAAGEEVLLDRVAPICMPSREVEELVGRERVPGVIRLRPAFAVSEDE